MVQAGHTALEAQFCHPIVDQQEVPQLREKGTKTSPPSRLPGCAARLPLQGFLREPLETNRASNPESILALTHVSQLLLLLLHYAKSSQPKSLPPGGGGVSRSHPGNILLPLTQSLKGVAPGSPRPALQTSLPPFFSATWPASSAQRACHFRQISDLLLGSRRELEPEVPARSGPRALRGRAARPR